MAQTPIISEHIKESESTQKSHIVLCKIIDTMVTHATHATYHSITQNCQLLLARMQWQSVIDGSDGRDGNVS